MAITPDLDVVCRYRWVITGRRDRSALAPVVIGVGVEIGEKALDVFDVGFGNEDGPVWFGQINGLSYIS